MFIPNNKVIATHKAIKLIFSVFGHILGFPYQLFFMRILVFSTTLGNFVKNMCYQLKFSILFIHKWMVKQLLARFICEIFGLIISMKSCGIFIFMKSNIITKYLFICILVSLPPRPIMVFECSYLRSYPLLFQLLPVFKTRKSKVKFFLLLIT